MSVDDDRNDEYVLSDETIAGVMQLLQVALLTGTDIVDLLRSIKFDVSQTSNTLSMTDASKRGVEKFCDDKLAILDSVTDKA